MLSGYRVRTALCAAVAVACLTPAVADAKLHPQTQGNITYITGGVGDSELAEFKAAAPDYNLQVTNSENNGEFVAGVFIEIKDKAGQQVLQLRNAGPLLYAQLPPGAYTLRAVYQRVERVQHIKIAGKGHSTVHVTWPNEG
jgi:type 1 fimbria pilin